MNLKELESALRALKEAIQKKVAQDASLFKKIEDQFNEWDVGYTKLLSSVMAGDKDVEINEKSKEYKEYETLKKKAEKLIEKLTPISKSESRLSVGPKKFFGFGARRNTVSSFEATSASSPSSASPPVSPRGPSSVKTVVVPSLTKNKFVFTAVDDFHKLFAMDPVRASQLVLQLIAPANLSWGVLALSKVKTDAEKIIDVLIQSLPADYLVKVFKELFKHADINSDENSLLLQMIQNFHKHDCCQKFKASVYAALTSFGELAARTFTVGARDSLTILQPVPEEANKRDSLGQFKPSDTGVLRAAFASMAEAIFLSNDMPESLLTISKLMSGVGGDSFTVLAKVVRSVIAEQRMSLGIKYDRQSVLMVMLSTIPTLILPVQSQMDGNDDTRKELIGDRDEFRQALCAKITVKLDGVGISSAEALSHQTAPTDIVLALNQLLDPAYVPAPSATSSQSSPPSPGARKQHLRAVRGTTFMGGGSGVPKEVVEKVAEMAKEKDKLVGDGSQNFSPNSSRPSSPLPSPSK